MRLRRLAAGLATALALPAACAPSHAPDDGAAPRDAAGSDARALDASASDASALDASGPDAPTTSDLDRLRALVAALPSAPDDAARRALVDAFFAAVTYGAQGLPIREEGQLAVAFFDPAATPGALAVAGDFDAWTQLPLAQPVAGFAFYYRIEPVAEPLPRTLYKFVRNGTDFFADPAARRYGYDANGPYSLAAAPPSASHLERWPSFASHAGALRPRDLLVYVPANPTAAPLPVLYMHDGQNLFDPSAAWGGWHAADAADAAIAAGDVPPFLVVAVPNAPERMDEYTHTTDLIDQATVGGRAREYADFLAQGIKPFVDARYPTQPDRAHTAVLGSSLGGLVSLYVAYAAPDLFGYAGAMSGTFGWGSIGGSYNRTLMTLYDAAPPAGVSYYLDSGGGAGTAGCVDTDGDGVRDDGADAADNYCETLQMADTLRAHGAVDGRTLAYAWAQGAEHNEAAWAARLPSALRAWFPGHR